MKKLNIVAIGLFFLMVFPLSVNAREQAILVPLAVKMHTERILEHPGVNYAYFYGDGKYIVSYSSSPEKRSIIWETQTGRKLFEVKELDISFDSDSMRVLTYHHDKREIVVYDVNTGNKLQSFTDGTKGFGYTSFQYKGKYVSSYSGKTRYFWDVNSGRLIMKQTGVTDAPWFYMYEHNKNKEKMNVLVSYGKDFDAVELWNASNWEKIGSFKGHTGGVSSASLTSKGQLVTAGQKDGKALLWDVQDQSIIHTFGGYTGSLYGYIYDDPNLFILHAYNEKKIVIWDAKSGNKLMTLNGGKEMPGIYFFDKYKYLAANYPKDQQIIELYDMKNGDKIKTLSGHTLPVLLASIYSDSFSLLSSSQNELILWNLKTFRKMLHLTKAGNYKAQYYHFGVPPHYKMFATYLGTNEISLWNTETGEKIRSYAGSIDGGDWNYGEISFSYDGKLMFVRQKKEKSIIVIEVSTGRRVEVIKGATEVPGITLGWKSDLGIVSKEEKGRLRIVKLSAPQNLVDEQYFAVDKAAAALQRERDIKIKELDAPKGEFETTAEYQARLKSVDAEKVRLTRQYQQKAEAVIVQAQKRMYPYATHVSLGRYDADRGGFEANFAGQHILFPVPRAKAIDLAKRRENVRLEGMLRYHSADHAELVNAYLVDEASQEKFGFGLQTGDTAVASAQRVLPDLKIQSIALNEPSGNGILDAGETGKIVIRAANKGKGTAFGVHLVLSASGGKGLRFVEKNLVGTISPGEEKDITVDISALEEEVVSSDITLKAYLAESSDFDSQPVILSFKTKEYLPPLLQVAKIDIEDADGGRVIGRGREVTVMLTVQNAGRGIARAVAASMEIGNKDIRLFSSNRVSIGTLRPGEMKKTAFTIAVTQKYKGARTLPLAFTVTEEHAKYSVRPDIKLALGEEAPEIKVVKVQARETAIAAVEETDIRLAPNLRDQQKMFGADDVAVVIGIERYQSLPKTDFSYNDAKLMREYLRALGFAERNIEYLVDDRATLSAIKKVVETRLPNIVKPSSRVLIYYSGHGSPDAATGEAYMVPFDGDPQYLADTAYPLRRLYEKLGSLPARDILVITDACFSGTGGRTVLARGARPIVMVDETHKPKMPSNVIVLSATQGAQISTFFPEKEQGLFTYYFLKALKEGKKDVYSVYQYIKPLVEDEAKRLNVSQSPTLSPDPEKLKGRFGLSR